MQIKEVKLSDIKPYDNNPRFNDEAVDAVAESITQFGFKVPIVLDRNGVIVTGHTRYKAAKAMSMDTVPCIYADDLADDQVKKFRILDNKVGEIAKWDFGKLEQELKELTFEGFDLDIENFPDEQEDDWEAKKKQFDERMKRGEISEEDEEYKEFLQKFEIAKTTDDCYTPAKVYDAVLEFCVSEYMIDKNKVVRPFYPGGDYQKEKYSADCVVVDNPPFSILSEICKFYADKKIKFFLFAPALTLFSSTASSKCTAISTSVSVIYENKASVSTSFLTNMEDESIRVKSEPRLYKMVDEAVKEVLKETKREIPKYDYPNNVLTASMVSYLSKYGQEFSVKKESSYRIGGLDSQKQEGKAIFGSGYLLSEKAAAEKAAAEKAAAEKAAAEKAAAEKAAAEKVNSTIWKLSDRELKIIEGLK